LRNKKQKKMTTRVPESNDDIWFSCDDGLRRDEMRNPVPLKYFKFTEPVNFTLKTRIKNTWDAVIPEEWLVQEFPDPDTRPTVIRFGEFCSDINATPIAQIPYLNMVSKFFTKEKIEKYLVPFLKRSIDVSLCNIDWLLTNYSKEKCLGYYLVREDKEKQTYSALKKEYVVLNNLYIKTLNMYRRRHFGSFRRSNRCWVRETGMETTVGQLIFLIWCIEWRVFDCAYYLLDKIEEHKILKTEQNKKEILEFKNRGEKRPRKELVEEPRQFPIIVGLI
jgi:hypothetical protein